MLQRVKSVNYVRYRRSLAARKVYEKSGRQASEHRRLSGIEAVDVTR
jgi:hypothetical protein